MSYVVCRQTEKMKPGNFWSIDFGIVRDELVNSNEKVSRFLLQAVVGQKDAVMVNVAETQVFLSASKPAALQPLRLSTTSEHTVWVEEPIGDFFMLRLSETELYVTLQHGSKAHMAPYVLGEKTCGWEQQFKTVQPKAKSMKSEQTRREDLIDVRHQAASVQHDKAAAQPDSVQASQAGMTQLSVTKSAEKTEEVGGNVDGGGQLAPEKQELQQIEEEKYQSKFGITDQQHQQDIQDTQNAVKQNDEEAGEDERVQ